MRALALGLVTLMLLAACGARSELGTSDLDAGAIDAGRVDASSVDGGRRDAGLRDAGLRDAGLRDAGLRDAASELDAGTVVCPERSDFGFRVRPLGPLLEGQRFDAIWLGGDGRFVYLAARDRDAFGSLRLYRLDGANASAREILTLPEVRRAHVSVVDGIGRMIAVDSDLVLVEARGDAATVIGRTEIFHASRLEPERPTWNGTDVIVAGSTGFLGSLRIGAESPSWLPLEGTLLALASQADTGFTEVIQRRAPGLVFESFDRAGTRRTPAEGVLLDAPELYVGPALGWLDADGTGQPIVLAGITRDDDGGFRATLQRFRLDGSAAGGFSAPIEAGFGTVDLTTSPVPPHAFGYGMVAAPFPGAALFHGAGEDFVGDGQALPFSCGDVTIAAGPCGYVIACLVDGAIELALAVPPDVR